MNNSSYRIVRTLRCKNSNIPGTLGKLTTAIGQIGAEIGNIETVHLAVAHSVARASMDSGVAQRKLDDDYFEGTVIKQPP
jgi:hypothetical protein